MIVIAIGTEIATETEIETVIEIGVALVVIGTEIAIESAITVIGRGTGIVVDLIGTETAGIVAEAGIVAPPIGTLVMILDLGVIMSIAAVEVALIDAAVQVLRVLLAAWYQRQETMLSH